MNRTCLKGTGTVRKCTLVSTLKTNNLFVPLAVKNSKISVPLFIAKKQYVTRFCPVLGGAFVPVIKTGTRTGTDLGQNLVSTRKETEKSGTNTGTKLGQNRDTPRLVPLPPRSFRTGRAERDKRDD